MIRDNFVRKQFQTIVSILRVSGAMHHNMIHGRHFRRRKSWHTRIWIDAHAKIRIIRDRDSEQETGAFALVVGCDVIIVMGWALAIEMICG